MADLIEKEVQKFESPEKVQIDLITIYILSMVTFFFILFCIFCSLEYMA